MGKTEQYYALGVLFLINTINFLDRLSISAVIDELKQYYTMESKDVGLLSTCFILGYMFTAPIFGYLGDRYSRKWLVIGGIAFWCLSCASGYIIPRDKVYLFYISRSLVGVGEASYSTIAPTLIGDFFEPDMRKTALAIFYLAIPIGSGLGFILGFIAHAVENWKLIFIATPTIGFICLFLVMLIKEPVRGQSEGLSNSDKKDDSTFMENLVYLTRIRSYVWATIGFTCCLFTTGALSFWSIEFFTSARGKDYKKTADLIFGISLGSGGLIGVILGSKLASYFKNFDPRADPLVCAVGIFLAVPLTFFGLIFAKSFTNLAWVFLFLAVTALSTNWAIVSDMVLTTVLPNKRAFATSVQILISHLFGDAASPYIVGFIRDALDSELGTGEEFHAFLYSLLPCLIILVLGTPAFLMSAKYYDRDGQKNKEAIEREISSDDTRATDMTGFAAADP